MPSAGKGAILLLIGILAFDLICGVGDYSAVNPSHGPGPWVVQRNECKGPTCSLSGLAQNGSLIAIYVTCDCSGSVWLLSSASSSPNPVDNASYRGLTSQWFFFTILLPTEVTASLVGNAWNATILILKERTA